MFDFDITLLLLGQPRKLNIFNIVIELSLFSFACLCLKNFFYVNNDHLDIILKLTIVTNLFIQYLPLDNIR